MAAMEYNFEGIKKIEKSKVPLLPFCHRKKMPGKAWGKIPKRARRNTEKCNEKITKCSKYKEKR